MNEKEFDEYYNLWIDVLLSDQEDIDREIERECWNVVEDDGEYVFW